MERIVLQPENDIETSENETLPEFLNMYEISGQGKITEHEQARYLASKKNYQEDINKKVNLIDAYKESIFKASADEKTGLIKLGFLEGSVEEQIICADMIHGVDEKDKPRLIEFGFTVHNERVQQICALQIKDVENEKRLDLFRKGLVLSSEEVWIAFMQSFESVPEKDRVELGEAALDVIENILLTGSIKKRINVSYLLSLVDVIKKEEILNRVLSSECIEVQKMFARVQDSLSIVQQEMVCDILKDGIVQKDRESIGLIEFIPENMRTEYIRKGLEMNDVAVQKECALLTSLVTDPEQKEQLFLTAKQKLGDHFVEPLMYEYDDIPDGRFFRKGFDKSGSGTTLLGGSLKFNSIIRHITPKAFVAWQKIYENHELWRLSGFDYVPIEPIQSFKINKSGTVDVSSGVLDMDLFSWELMFEQFKAELEEDKEKIKSVLKKVNFKHGHDHEKNFCLRFYRDEKGRVDFDRKPRLYMIDFDAAEYPENKV